MSKDRLLYLYKTREMYLFLSRWRHCLLLVHTFSCIEQQTTPAVQIGEIIHRLSGLTRSSCYRTEALSHYGADDTSNHQCELPPRCVTSSTSPPLPYLSAQGGDVPLEGGVHPVEGLGFAEVLAHVLRELLQLLLDLSHQLLPVVKVPGRQRENKQSPVSWHGSMFSSTVLCCRGAFRGTPPHPQPHRQLSSHLSSSYDVASS